MIVESTLYKLFNELFIEIQNLFEAILWDVVVVQIWTAFLEPQIDIAATFSGGSADFDVKAIMEIAVDYVLQIKELDLVVGTERIRVCVVLKLVSLLFLLNDRPALSASKYRRQAISAEAFLPPRKV